MSTESNSITLGDFCPWNTWSRVMETVTVRDKVFNYGTQLEKDLTTNRVYLIQSADTLRIKNVGLLIWTVAAHVQNTVLRVFTMLSLYTCLENSDKLTLSDRLTLLGKDVLKLAATPVVVVALEAAALYGMICPKEGRKEYASIERFSHSKLGIRGRDLFGRNSPYCAPCYQPDFGRDRY